MTTRRWCRGLVLAALTAGLVGATAVPASAHPLGNFTVNHYDGLHLLPDAVEDAAVIDTAEIPTLQQLPSVDRDHDGTVDAAEGDAWAREQCASLAAGLRLAVGGRRAVWSVGTTSFDYRPGAAGLRTSRLECGLRAPVDLHGPADVTFTDEFASSGIGWHEITARADGVRLDRSPVPAASISDELRRYPNDLLSSPLGVRSVALRVLPGSGSTYAGGFRLAGSDPLPRVVNRLSRTLTDIAGRRQLTLGVGLLAMLVAFLLGAGHALLPGHGKTIMAAYVVSRRGRLRDVLTLGATVTATHTAGVVVVGLLISGASAFAPVEAERDLGVLSGLVVAGAGIVLLRSAHRARRQALVAPAAALTARALVASGAVAAPADDHGHDHRHHHHDHDDHHDHPHRHGLFGRHLDATPRQGRGVVVGLGVAGGLVPSPSALVVLLGAVALGRTAFGLLLVLVYGLGLAATLAAAGFLLVPLGERVGRIVGARRTSGGERLLAALPTVTAVLVTVVGVALAARSLTLA